MTSAGPFDDSTLCRLPEPLPLERARRVLVLAPHPDDEAIGCGGLIARLMTRGVPTRVALVTDGAGAGALSPEDGARRCEEFEASLARLGGPEFTMLGLPDGGLVAGEALDAAIAREVTTFAPNWLVAPGVVDAHRDHRRVAEAARRAALDAAAVEWLVSYETWSPLAVATHVLDIRDSLAAKLSALSQHRTALAHVDYLQATEGLTRYRALLLGQPGLGGAAEAFQVSDRSSGFVA